MNNQDDFRFKSHELLIELDAATTSIMMLVTAGLMNGPTWNDAVKRHRLALEQWQSFMDARNQVEQV